MGEKAREGRQTDQKLGQTWNRIRTTLGPVSGVATTEILPKSCPGRAPRAPRIDPGSLPEHPWAVKIHSFPPSRPEKGESRRKSAESWPKGPALGTGWDPKIGPRSGRGRKKDPFGRCATHFSSLLVSMCVQSRVFRRCSTIFWTISERLDCKNRIIPP